MESAQDKQGLASGENPGGDRVTRRVLFADDPALWIAALGSSLLAIPGIGAVGILWIFFGGELLFTPEILFLVALSLPLVLGLMLLVGYWRAIWGTLRRPGRLWWTSLAANVVVVGASLVGAWERPEVWPLAAWGGFMCVLSWQQARDQYRLDSASLNDATP
ncbi:MAG: hypothetical protein AAGI52_10620 [Bacteroidota bacterium]